MSMRIEIEIDAEGYPYVATENIEDGVLRISIRRRKPAQYSPEEEATRKGLADIVEYLRTFRLSIAKADHQLYQAACKIASHYPDEITALQALKDTESKYGILSKISNLWSMVDYMKKVSTNPETVGECQSKAYKREPVRIGEALRKLKDETRR